MPFSVLLSLLELLSPSGTPRGKAALSAGGDATHSPDAELVFPQREAMENELIDSACIRRFAGIDLVTDDIPDATTILAFRHFGEAPVGREDL